MTMSQQHLNGYPIVYKKVIDATFEPISFGLYPYQCTPENHLWKRKWIQEPIDITATVCIAACVVCGTCLLVGPAQEKPMGPDTTPDPPDPRTPD